MTISTEQFIAINIGASANDGTGESLRSAFSKINDNFSNISLIGFDAGNINCQGSIDIGANIYLSSDYVPAAADSDGDTGQLAWDEDYIYVCTATDTWKRANLVAW
jgi:hypothetical protein